MEQIETPEQAFAKTREPKIPPSCTCSRPHLAPSAVQQQRRARAAIFAYCPYSTGSGAPAFVLLNGFEAYFLLVEDLRIPESFSFGWADEVVA